MTSWIVFRREIAQFLTTPFAYVIGAAVLLLTGILFNRDLNISFSTKPADPALVPGILSFAMVFFAPLLTMRMFAEEQREGTMELLLTAPVRELSIVLGKFLGAWAYFTLLLLLTGVYQVILLSITAPDLGHALSAYIGIWLYGGATLTVGMVFSALTENQIVAAFLGMVALMLLWLADQAGQLFSNIDVAIIFRTMSLQGHFSTSFASGLMRAEDVAFFAGIIAVMLFITAQILESQRWHG
ncbi:MAG: ABC transporter permease [Anaerolineae bacterium]|nr:ABC transporter permease [Anaerolineae bacterium]NUQ02318.1 ABC transporter permease [Anaerolineae bacterium]